MSGLGKHRRQDFAMACGEMPASQFTDFLAQSFRLMAEHSIDGSIHFACMDWRHMREMLDAGEQVYSELKNLIVWAKDNGGMGTFYRSRHELIFASRRARRPTSTASSLVSTPLQDQCLDLPGRKLAGR